MARSAIVAYTLLIILTIPVYSAVVELPSTNDAGIWQNYPDNNYGTSNYMWVGYNTGFVDSLIEFGGLSSYMGATVNEAILELYISIDWGNPHADNQAYLAAESWEESTVTWNNRPDLIGDINIPFGTPPVTDWLVVDVSTVVQDWLDATYDNYGFYILTLSFGYGGFYCYSKEYINDVYRPKLTLDYIPGAVESASLGSMKAVFR
ncbi:MAG: DNRLRE domain-containing protein [bacterium]|nr:DNRLRE domain-containing protein [bacterium]